MTVARSCILCKQSKVKVRGQSLPSAGTSGLTKRSAISSLHADAVADERRPVCCQAKAATSLSGMRTKSPEENGSEQCDNSRAVHRNHKKAAPQNRSSSHGSPHRQSKQFPERWMRGRINVPSIGSSRTGRFRERGLLATGTSCYLHSIAMLHSLHPWHKLCVG